jgi:hypothetical protein
MHWSVWTSSEAVGTGSFIDMGTFPITVTLTRGRTACGHLAFARAKLGNGPTIRLNDWCL